MTRRTRIALALGQVAAVLLWFGGAWIEHHVDQLEARIAAFGRWALLVYVVAYTVLVPCFFPESVLLLAAGAVFGVLEGSVAAMVGTVLSGVSMFLLGRHLLRRRVSRWVDRHPQFGTLDAALGRNDLRLLLWLRVPPLPYAPVSYVLGCSSRVTLLPYCLALAGRLPEVIMTVYLGFAARHLTGAAGGSASVSTLHHTVVFGGLLLSVAVCVTLAREARKTLVASGVRL